MIWTISDDLVKSERAKLIMNSQYQPILQMLNIIEFHVQFETLPKAKRTQAIECFDSINTFISKQKLQQSLKSWSKFSLILFGKGQ